MRLKSLAPDLFGIQSIFHGMVDMFQEMTIDITIYGTLWMVRVHQENGDARCAPIVFNYRLVCSSTGRRQQNKQSGDDNIFHTIHDLSVKYTINFISCLNCW